MNTHNQGESTIKLQKSSYNRSYYSINKGKILEKARNRVQPKSKHRSNVLSIFHSNIVPQLGSKVIGHSLPWPPFGRVMLSLLVLAMSYFLMNETAHFFLSADGNRIEAYLKALILEGAVITFSLIQPKTRLLGFTYRSMVAAIYIYGIWVISASAINTAYQNHRQIEIYQNMSQELRAEILKVEASRDELWRLRRITHAQRYETTLAELKNQLAETRKTIIQLPARLVIWNTLGSHVCFRILVMLSNFLCLNYLGRKQGGRVEAN